MACSSSPRCLVWSLWLINLLISCVYLGISMVSFHNVKSGVQRLGSFPNKDAFKNSLLASCILGFLIVLFWIVFSFIVLLGRFFSSLPLGYGAMLGSCSHTGFFMLLAGLVLQTHENLAAAFRDARIWSDSAYNTYLATFSFSYVLCGTYLIMFIVLLFTAGSFSEKKKERSEPYSASSAPSAAPPATPPAATSGTVSGVQVQDNHGFGTNWGGTYGGTYRGGNV